MRKLYWNLINRHVYGITGPFRILPDYIIIGAMKSGTTSLNFNLSEHPCIIPASFDEIGFFDVNFNLGLNWYRSFFPTSFKKNKILSKYGHFCSGEDTPFYFWREDAAERIKNLIPNTKFLLILRNPVDRAYSNYTDGLIKNPNLPSFENTIKHEIALISEENTRISIHKNSIFSRDPSHIAKGFYAEQLDVWFKYFSKKQFHFISTEDLSINPVETMNTVFNFLQLPEYEIKIPQKRKCKNYKKMNSDTRNFLINYYQPHNTKLYQLIGKKFDWDK